MARFRTRFPGWAAASLLAVACLACGSETGSGDTGILVDVQDSMTSDVPAETAGDAAEDEGVAFEIPVEIAQDTADADPSEDVAEDVPPDEAVDLPPDSPDAPGEALEDVVPVEVTPETLVDLPEDSLPEVAADLPSEAVDRPQVAVNEVVALAPNQGPDWIELFNFGSANVDLAGWTLTDDNDLHVFTFPVGTHIKAGRFLVIEGPGGVPPLATLFGFGKSDSVRLFDASGGAVDQTTWIDGQAPLANSWGRHPDGTGAFATLLQPTRGSPNVAP